MDRFPNASLITVFCFVHSVFGTLLPHRMKLMGGSKEICDSAACYSRAAGMLRSIDLTVDPCDDFYSYACGGLFKSPNKSDPLLYPLSRMNMKGLANLEAIFRELPDVSESRNAEEKVAVAYHVCTNSQLSEEQEIQAVKRALAARGFESWPLLADNSTEQRQFGNATDVFHKIGICSVLKCVLYTTTNGPNDRLLALEIEKSGNYDRCWRNLLLKHTSSSNETKDTADLEFLVTTMTNMIKPDLREEQRKKFVEDMIAFFTEEGKPRNGTIKPVKVPAKGNKTTGLKTIRQLEEALDGFPLLNVLNSQFRLWNTTFTESELVAIGGIGKVKALLDFYMDNDPYVVFNNFGLKEAAKLLRYSSKQYLNSLMSLCNESQTTRERFCVGLLRQKARHIVSKWYGERYLGSHSRMEARYILSYIGAAFDERLKSTPWMDEVTKRKARDKLRKITPRVGYPLELWNNSFIEPLYSNVGQVFRNESLSAIISRFDDNTMYLMVDELRSHKKLRRDLLLDYSDTNSRYLVSYNTIAILAGFLQDFFYNESVPLVLNLGAIGRTMAHEMTHAFGVQGKQFDSNGRKVNWWTQYASSKFEEKKKCFLEQYGSIVDTLTNKTIDGKMTLDENIADCGGIRVAYLAHLTLRGGRPEVTLPGLENFTQDQLFFLSFATAWCENEDAARSRPLNPHPRSRYRVNVPLKNMEEFSAAFRCPKGSPMRLPDEERCVMW